MDICQKLFLGLRLPMNKHWQRKWIIRILRNRGATVEGNPEARADTLKRSKNSSWNIFVRESVP